MKQYHFTSGLILFFCLSTSISIAQSVAINTDGSTANNSAILDIKSSNKGVLIPRMTKAERSAIASPATGLMVYQTGPDSTGFHYYDGAAWSWVSKATINTSWVKTGNGSTTPGTDYIGTSDPQALVIKTAGTEAMRIDATGKVGIGNPAPAQKLDVTGSVRFQGDFINQEITGIHANTIQNIPFTNGVFTPINGTSTSITIADGNGVNNSGVLILGHARVFSSTLNGNSGSFGAYFMILQRDVDPAFPSPTILTYTSDICYMRTPNGASSTAFTFGSGGHVSYLDNSLTAGVTYYYRLCFYANGSGTTAGTYDIYERDLIVVQIKR